MAAASTGRSGVSGPLRGLFGWLRAQLDNALERLVGGDPVVNLRERMDEVSKQPTARGGVYAPPPPGTVSFTPDMQPSPGSEFKGDLNAEPTEVPAGGEEAPAQHWEAENEGIRPYRSARQYPGMEEIVLEECGTHKGRPHYGLPDEHVEHLTSQTAAELDALEAWEESPSPLPAASVGALPAPPTRLALPLDVSTLSTGDIVDRNKISHERINEVCTRLCRSGLAFSNVTPWITQSGHTAFVMTGLGDADTTRITTRLDPVLGTVDMWGPPGVLGATATEGRTYCRFTLLDEAGKPLEDQALNHALAGMDLVQGKMGRAACENAGILPPRGVVAEFVACNGGCKAVISPSENAGLHVVIGNEHGVTATLWCNNHVCGGEMTTPGGDTVSFDRDAIASGEAAAAFAAAAAEAEVAKEDVEA